MKYLYYVQCLLRRVSLKVGMAVWFVYWRRQHTPWFKQFFGQSIFAVHPIKLLMLSPIFDFLSDDGVEYVLNEIERTRPTEEAITELGLFTSEFTSTIGKSYLSGGGLDAYIVADDFGILRTLYLRNLLPIIAPSQLAEDEDVVWKALLTYQLTPELNA